MRDLFQNELPKDGPFFKAAIDGASSGNPGPAGIGAVLFKDNRVIRNLSKFIGTTTNNVAEYTALILALEELLKLKAKRVIINTDSQLLANQLKGKFKVKNQALKVFHAKALSLFSLFERIEINNVPRSENSAADRLAVKAIKELARMVARHRPVAGGKSELQRET